MSFIYRNLPEYTKEITDILFDINNQGQRVKQLEEYCKTIDEDLLYPLREYISSITDFYNVDNVKDEILPYLGILFGYIWDYNIDVEYQREVLKNIVYWYKRKGTPYSLYYRLFYHDNSVNIYEPSQWIWILNKSKLNDVDKLPSRNYYSRGIFAVRSSIEYDILRKYIEETRPVGTLGLIEYYRSMFAKFDDEAKKRYLQLLLDIRNYIPYKFDAYRISRHVGELSGTKELWDMLTMNVFNLTYTGTQILAYEESPSPFKLEEYLSHALYYPYIREEGLPYSFPIDSLWYNEFGYNRVITKSEIGDIIEKERNSNSNIKKNILQPAVRFGNMSIYRNDLQRGQLRNGTNYGVNLNLYNSRQGDPNWLEFDPPIDLFNYPIILLDATYLGLHYYSSSSPRYELLDDYTFEEVEELKDQVSVVGFLTEEEKRIRYLLWQYTDEELELINKKLYGIIIDCGLFNQIQTEDNDIDGGLFNQDQIEVIDSEKIGINSSIYKLIWIFSLYSINELSNIKYKLDNNLELTNKEKDIEWIFETYSIGQIKELKKKLSYDNFTDKEKAIIHFFDDYTLEELIEIKNASYGQITERQFEIREKLNDLWSIKNDDEWNPEQVIYYEKIKALIKGDKNGLDYVGDDLDEILAVWYIPDDFEDESDSGLFNNSQTEIIDSGLFDDSYTDELDGGKLSSLIYYKESKDFIKDGYNINWNLNGLLEPPTGSEYFIRYITTEETIDNKKLLTIIQGYTRCRKNNILFDMEFELPDIYNAGDFSIEETERVLDCGLFDDTQTSVITNGGLLIE